MVSVGGSSIVFNKAFQDWKFKKSASLNIINAFSFLFALVKLEYLIISLISSIDVSMLHSNLNILSK